MINADAKARENLDRKITKKYVKRKTFIKDSFVAAGKSAATAGVRELIGFCLAEVWFVVQDSYKSKEFQDCKDIKSMMKFAGKSILKGLENAKIKYRDGVERVFKGAFSGFFSSISNTVINLFEAKGKKFVKAIRLLWAHLVKFLDVLFINAKKYRLGDKIKEGAKIIFLAAGTLISYLSQEGMSNWAAGISLPGPIEKIKDSVIEFFGILTGSIVSGTLLVFVDKSEKFARFVKYLNEQTYTDKLEEQFYKFAAESLHMEKSDFNEYINVVDEGVKKITAVTERTNKQIIDAFCSYIQKVYNMVSNSYNSLAEYFFSSTTQQIYDSLPCRRVYLLAPGNTHTEITDDVADLISSDYNPLK